MVEHHRKKYWVMGTGVYHAAPAGQPSSEAVLICECKTVEQAHAIVGEIERSDYMPQDIAMEINAMLQPWDAVGEHGNTTWALVKHVTERLLVLEPSADRQPDKKPEWRK